MTDEKKHPHISLQQSTPFTGEIDELVVRLAHDAGRLEESGTIEIDDWDREISAIREAIGIYYANPSETNPFVIEDIAEQIFKERFPVEVGTHSITDQPVSPDNLRDILWNSAYYFVRDNEMLVTDPAGLVDNLAASQEFEALKNQLAGSAHIEDGSELYWETSRKCFELIEALSKSDPKLFCGVCFMGQLNAAMNRTAQIPLKGPGNETARADLTKTMPPDIGR